MAKHKICIDLGTANTLIWTDAGKTIAFNEPTIIAIDKQKQEVVEIGYLAHKMIGRTPYGVDVIFPIQNGVIADLDACLKYIERAFNILRLEKLLHNSYLYFATPSNITPVEQEALIQLGIRLGAKKVNIDSALKMSALRTGTDIYSPHGTLVLDIGAGVTNVGIIALGDIVYTKAFYLAGNSFTKAIIKHLRKNHHLVIGEKTAEYIKMKIGSVNLENSNQLLEVNGRDQITGLPHSIILSENEIANCLLPFAQEILDLVIEALEKSPAEITADVANNGLVLCGGGGLLNGLREYLSSKLGIMVHLASFPQETVIKGLIEYSNNSFVNKYEKEE